MATNHTIIHMTLEIQKMLLSATKITTFHQEETHPKISTTRAAQSYLAVLLGPNCLAEEAEIQGFLLEAVTIQVIGTD